MPGQSLSPRQVCTVLSSSTSRASLAAVRRYTNAAPSPQPPEVPVRMSMRSLLRTVFVEVWSREVWPTSAQVRLGVVFLVALVCSWSGIVLSRQSEGVATIWISNGVLFGLLITQPPRRWLPYFAAGLCADTLADVVYGDPFRIAIGVSCANSVEVVCSSLILALLFGAPLSLSRRRPLVGFLLVSVLGATALTSVLGAAWTMLFLDAGPWWQLVRTWYLGDMLGMAVLAPLIVILQRPSFFAVLHRDHLLHTLGVLAVPAATAVLVFTHDGDPLIFFLFPTFLLVAFRLGFPGTVLNIVLIATLAIGFTVKGHGPLMLIRGEHMMLHRIVIAQIFVAVAIFTMFPVAALLEEKEQLKTSLAASELKFRSLAHMDELTGLFNRRAFNLHLEDCWERAIAEGHSLGLILLDADMFKQYNDVYGHIGGDECLRALAAALASVVKTTAGTAARFGGEEFAVILPECSREGARRVAESIRQAVAGRGMPHPATPTGVQTVSLGVAATEPEAGQSSVELVNQADIALYAAKVLGRNQVACA